LANHKNALVKHEFIAIILIIDNDTMRPVSACSCVAQLSEATFTNSHTLIAGERHLQDMKERGGLKRSEIIVMCQKGTDCGRLVMLHHPSHLVDGKCVNRPQSGIAKLDTIARLHIALCRRHSIPRTADAASLTR